METYLQSKYIVRIFTNPYEVMAGIDEETPDLILSETLLPGANVFSLLNELISYSDTVAIPVILFGDKSLREMDLKVYNVKAILEKESLRPEVLVENVEKFC